MDKSIMAVIRRLEQRLEKLEKEMEVLRKKISKPSR